MSNLKDSKKYTDKLTVLYVDDSNTLLKLVSLFLNNIFKKVYTASNGVEGLESYKVNNPDIVITDLTMPKMDGHNLIKNIKKINPDAPIIIISAHSDSQNLLEVIHMGVSDFIPKPIDLELLQNALFKIANKLNKNNNILDIDKINEENDLIKKLEFLSSNHIKIEFINQYRGVPIIHEGHITDISNNTISVHAPSIQTLAIKYQKHTTIESELLKIPIEAELYKIEPHTREIQLTNFKKLEFSSKNRKKLRVEVDDKFITIIHINDHKIDTKINNLSKESISLNIDIKNLTINIDDIIDLAFGFKLYTSNQFGKHEKDERIYTKGKIFKIIKNTKPNNITIIVLFELNTANNNILEKYIYNRQFELIKEFKQLKKRFEI
ncbi:MAG: response regulator [Arcobacteraceae bacterium]|nr:response regulator [Arcobacteraceae bacterium]